MTQYTDEDVQAMVNEAVAKTEKSFAGTFKRLKTENEELAAERDGLAASLDETARGSEERLAALEAALETGRLRIVSLTMDAEIAREIAKSGPLPEQFIDRTAIEWSDDPETLRENVRAAVEAGRDAFGETLREMGITPAKASPAFSPTNPPAGGGNARDLARSGARDALGDMTRRGLLR